MKSKLLLTLLSIFSLSVKAEINLNNLVIWAKDGTKVAYALNEKPMVTFTETDLIITSRGIEVNYPLDNMDRFTYEAGNADAITNLQADNSTFKIEDESLLFPVLKANTTVSVYSPNGTIVLKKHISHNGEYAFPLSDLGTGVYIVKVNGTSYKIMKK